MSKPWPSDLKRRSAVIAVWSEKEFYFFYNVKQQVNVSGTADLTFEGSQIFAPVVAVDDDDDDDDLTRVLNNEFGKALEAQLLAPRKAYPPAFEQSSKTHISKDEARNEYAEHVFCLDRRYAVATRPLSQSVDGAALASKRAAVISHSAGVQSPASHRQLAAGRAPGTAEAVAAVGAVARGGVEEGLAEGRRGKERELEKMEQWRASGCGGAELPRLLQHNAALPVVIHRCTSEFDYKSSNGRCNNPSIRSVMGNSHGDEGGHRCSARSREQGIMGRRGELALFAPLRTARRGEAGAGDGDGGGCAANEARRHASTDASLPLPRSNGFQVSRESWLGLAGPGGAALPFHGLGRAGLSRVGPGGLVTAWRGVARRGAGTW
ncbi:Protein of unknown function [Gryllus bimaculatus]|nr:Protein of unknown function [Gryllus bimaculatus]